MSQTPTRAGYSQHPIYESSMSGRFCQNIADDAFFALFLAHRMGMTTSDVAMLFATYSAARSVTEVPLGRPG